MRFVLVATIWVVLVGGLALYMYQRDRQKHDVHAVEPLVQAPAEAYTLEITPDFTTAGDPFALRGDPASQASLLVRAADREILRSERPVQAGVTQTVSPVPGLVLGRNEIYLKAVPPVGQARDHAVRVRLKQGDTELFDRTLWGRNGTVVSGTIPFELSAGSSYPVLTPGSEAARMGEVSDER